MENLEVILVNDCSTDNTKAILEDFKAKYSNKTPNDNGTDNDSTANKAENIKVIHLEENIGGAYGPRNMALKKATGKYLMFVDSDDTFTNDACEILFNKIEEYGCDIAFGRYLRHYTEDNIIRKSYTPYKETLNQPFADYLDDLVKGSNFKGALGFIWKNLISYFFYGNQINKDNNEEILIKDLKEENKEEIAILKILPSFWSKIYRRELIEKNNIAFPEYVSAEDLNFLLECYFKSENGILFLNNKVVYNYFMRFEVEEKSLTKNINFRLVDDSLKAYKASSELCDKYNIKNKSLFLNPYLLNWLNLWLSRENTKEENKLFLKELQKLKMGKGSGIKYKLILFTIETLLKLKS